MHCRAHLVSMSVWSDNKIAPCCVWAEEPYDDLQTMQSDLDLKFRTDNIPAGCNNCTYRHGLDMYDPADGLQLLDIRNDNICNLKCRSCGPQWSSRWASELNVIPVRKYLPYKLDGLDLSNLKTAYFCGGEPLLSPDHVVMLNAILTTCKSKPRLVYNTNCTTLYSNNVWMPDLWKSTNTSINASIDAVEKHAEVVRSGSNWNEIQQVLTQLEMMRCDEKFNLSVTPVMSAINIWWFDKWLAFFDHWEMDQVWPIATQDSCSGLCIIPENMRPALISMLEHSKFAEKFRPTIEVLKNNFDSDHNWSRFINDQKQLDLRRSEQWYNQFTSSIFYKEANYPFTAEKLD